MQTQRICTIDTVPNIKNCLPFREWNVSINNDFVFDDFYLNIISKILGFSIDLDAPFQKLALKNTSNSGG